ncbi:hypothetical protein KJ359_009792 [Pestalotiopsis sp. 9143b]|nr:hypothetical protein KJ359_009792 [Pestalotiopsis sp. 9143b]
MRLLTVAVASGTALALRNGEPKPGPDGKYTISTPSIKAQDKSGDDIDVVLGYDVLDYYAKDPGHPVYNSIPGRYVNRIGHGHYSIDNVTYTTELNDGNNTLHSGTNNWSYRTWNVTDMSDTSVTFSIMDASNSSLGMLGRVDASVTYSVDKSTWKISMKANSPDRKTPLMLTQHTYFNLDAYRDPSTDKVWDHTLHLPYSSRYLEADQGALPTGKILTAAKGSINDFASAPNLTLGHARDEPGFEGNCGADGACEGYNGYWLIDRPANTSSRDAVVATLASPFSGVRADLRTDQAGVVVYSCNWFDGTAALKRTQGLRDRHTVGRSSCVALEAQDWVDGINQ